MNNGPGLMGDPFPVFDGDIKRIWRDWITCSWIAVLDDVDLAHYDEAMAKLPGDYANWLENGGPC